MNPSEPGVFGNAAGMHSLNSARLDARTICQHFFKTAAKCVEYALILPRGYSATQTGPTLNQSGQRAYSREYLEKQTAGKFEVFAATGAFGVGYSRGYDTLAREQALLQCKAASAKSRAEMSPKIREILPLKSGLACKVVHESR